MGDLVQDVYDRLGGTYISSKHRTVKFFYLLQDDFLSKAVMSTRNHNPNLLSEMQVLTIGCGPWGNSRQTTGVLDTSRERGDRFLDSHKVINLDISKNVLDSYFSGLCESLAECGGWYMPQKFVIGDARALPFQETSFDIIIAALCDHIDPQEQFYREVSRVLKPKGAFITTYPAKELNTVVRTNYGINPRTTRFRIDGEEFVIPSHLVTETDLEEMYLKAGFVNVRTSNLHYDSSDAETQPFLKKQGYDPSQTVLKAAALMGKPLEEIPVLVGGIGFKHKSFLQGRAIE